MKVISSLVAVALVALLLAFGLQGRGLNGEAATPQGSEVQEGATEHAPLPDTFREVIPESITARFVDQDGTPISGCVLELTVPGENLGSRKTDEDGSIELPYKAFYAIHVSPPGDSFFPGTILGHLEGSQVFTFPQVGEIRIVNESPGLVKSVEIIVPEVAMTGVNTKASLEEAREMLASKHQDLHGHVEELALTGDENKHAFVELSLLTGDEGSPVVIPDWEHLGGRYSQSEVLVKAPPVKNYCVLAHSPARVNIEPQRQGVYENGFSGFFPVQPGQRIEVVVSAPQPMIHGWVDFGEGVEIDKVQVTLRREIFRKREVGGRKVVNYVDEDAEAVEFLYEKDGDFYFAFYDHNPGSFRIHAIGKEVGPSPTTYWIASSDLLWVNGPSAPLSIRPGQYMLQVDSGFVDSLGAPLDAADFEDPEARVLLEVKNLYTHQEMETAATSNGTYDYFLEVIPMTFGETIVIKGLGYSTWALSIDELPVLKSGLMGEPVCFRREILVAE